MTLSPEAQAIAERHAAEDRDLLARLRRSGAVRRRDGEYEVAHPQVARPFVADIERRAFPPKNLAIRPNAKKAKKGKRR